MNNAFSRLAPAVALCLPLVALGQNTDASADPKASAQTWRYPSAFADYKPWRDIKPGDWRQLNDRIAPAPGQAGHGHGRNPSPGASAAPGPGASGPAAPGHSGSSLHGGHR